MKIETLTKIIPEKIIKEEIKEIKQFISFDDIKFNSLEECENHEYRMLRNEFCFKEYPSKKLKISDNDSDYEPVWIYISTVEEMNDLKSLIIYAKKYDYYGYGANLDDLKLKEWYNIEFVDRRDDYSSKYISVTTYDSIVEQKIYELEEIKLFSDKLNNILECNNIISIKCSCCGELNNIPFMHKNDIKCSICNEILKS